MTRKAGGKEYSMFDWLKKLLNRMDKRQPNEESQRLLQSVQKYIDEVYEKDALGDTNPVFFEPDLPGMPKAESTDSADSARAEDKSVISYGADAPYSAPADALFDSAPSWGGFADEPEPFDRDGFSEEVSAPKARTYTDTKAERERERIPLRAPEPAASEPKRSTVAPKGAPQKIGVPDWDTLLRKTDEGFSDALLRMIDEKGLTDAECYKRANVDRKLFSKIRSNPTYKPSKPTVFSFIVAMELTLPEAQELLYKAGFALSHSSKFDIILEYFIKNRSFNLHDINEVLYRFDMPLLGSGVR